MLMYPNEIITEELCPNCDNPEPVEVRHGRNDQGFFVHDYDCDECGGFMSLVGYDCPECAMLPANKVSQSDVCQTCGTIFIPKGEVEPWEFCPVCGTRR
jgi:predicted RNA-binding Zn-ribbon protein involved in translation (DUF1610 family)